LGPRAAAQVPESARQDFYYRETLQAISDWEDALAGWTKRTADTARTPVFPAPQDGRAVPWLNPIPSLLLPDDESRETLRVSLAPDSKIRVERSLAGRPPRSERFDPGARVIGPRHPGGGGKDQWYHGYTRRFDGFLAFRPEPAPFAISLATPFDPGLGSNTLRAEIANVSARDLDLAVGLEFVEPSADVPVAAERLSIPAGQTRPCALGYRLANPGGKALRLKLAVADRNWWLPFLAHVENVPAVLRSLEQMLADVPDADALETLARLRAQAGALLAAAREGQPEAGQGREWRKLFENTSALRETLLLRRLPFDTLLFVRRKPYFSEQPFMDAHHLFNRPGGEICRLTPVRPDGRVTALVNSLGEGIYRDLCLHWDARRFLFSFGNGSDKWKQPQSYHIYEADVQGGGLRQLTRGPKNDCEPFYLPAGQIGFTSDRAEHFVMCGGDRHVANLFVMEADGALPRQLSFNVFNDFNPSVLADGRIVYSRWEYNERSVTSLHKLFTANPDGTMVAPFYGNATLRPNVAMFPRAVPGSRKVMTLFTAHHGQTHGPIGLVDVDQGVDGEKPIAILTPGVPVTGEKIEDSRRGWFSDPWPLSEELYLCSYTPTVVPWLEKSWALYLGDRHGNLALIHRDPAISLAEPVPLTPRPMPLARPTAPPSTDATAAEAEVLLMDVYHGLPGVERGQVRFLRVIEDVPRKGVTEGGVVVTAATGIYTVKRILGLVPVEEDGSAFFVVPANRNVYFEALDAGEREIQRMRSVVCLKPEEQRTCAGCHESRSSAPPNRPVLAAARAPSRPLPPPWGERTLSFLRDIQPILNRKCLGCHAYDRPANNVILTDDLTDQFNVAYEELLPFLSTANAMRWDHPDDVLPRPPLTYGSKVSPLTRLLEAGHYDTRLTREEWTRLFAWIDANGVYYDRYESSRGDRHLFSTSVRKAFSEIANRRCARCHGGGAEGRRDTWALSLDWRAPASSRALMAPLARAAGGWERCDEAVFADTTDPDYQKLLGLLRGVHSELGRRPREDLLSAAGSEIERRPARWPEPPARKVADTNAPRDGQVYLSDLPWASARAGWSPNQDGLPRKDRDIEGRRLQLGGKTCRKGLGTHAPSEIVYRLDGSYARFRATVGGGEAGGTVVFQVLADGRALFDSGVLQGLKEVKTVDVPLGGARELRLVVTDAGDGFNSDVANWGDARLEKADAAMKPQAALPATPAPAARP